MKKTKPVLKNKKSSLPKSEQKSRAGKSGASLSAVISPDSAALLHELEACRNELELRNQELRVARQQLDASRRRREDVCDYTPVGYFSFDEKGLIKDVNLTGARMLALEKNLVLNNPFSRFVEPEHLDQFHQHAATVAYSNAGHTCELKIRRADGASFHALLQSVSFKAKEGGKGECRVAVSDISEQKSLEQRLKESEERYRTLVESSPEAIAVFQGELCVYANPAGLALFGAKSATELFGRKKVDFVEHDVSGGVPLWLCEADEREGGQAARELRIRRLNGQTLNVELVSTQILLAGKPAIQLIFKDVTARKMAEQALRFQADVLSQVNDAVVVIDNEHRITYWNHGAEKLYQTSAAEALGRNPGEVNPCGWTDPTHEAAARLALLESGFWRGEGTHCGRSGKKLYVESSISVLRDENGASAGLLAVMHDITDRKSLEQELRKSEEEFRSMFELSAVGKIQVNIRTNRFMRVNKKFCDITGFAEEELLAKTLSQITHPDDTLSDIELYQRVLRRESPDWTSEKRYVRKDNRVIWVKVTGTVIFSNQGQPLRTIAVIEDITERKQAEQALKDSEERYRSLVESSPEAICVQQEGYCVYVNPAGVELLGAENFEEVKGKKSIDFIHPDFREKAVERVRQIEEEGRQAPARELKILRLNGQVLDVEAVASPTMFRGRPATQVIIKDITDRKNTELRLRLQATVLSQVSDAVVAVGREGRIIFWNKGAERLYKIPAEEAIGRLREDIYTYRWVISDDEDALKESMAASGILRGENIHMLKSGEEIFVESSVSILTDWSNAPAGWLAIMRDISERKVFEQKLKESEERYRSLVESSPDAIILFQDGKVIYANPATVRLLRASDVTEIAGKSPIDFVHPDSLQGAQKRFGVTEQGRPVLPLETKIVRLDGSVVYVDSVGASVSYRGRPATQIMAKDVTERKQFEEALRNSERLYRLMFESNPHPMWIYDMDTLNFLFVNDAAIAHYGYSKEEFLSMSLKDIRPAEETAVLCDNVSKIAIGLHDSGNWRHRKKDGTIIDVEIISHNLKVDGQDARVVLANDITERKKAEENLKQARDTALRERNRLEAILNTIPSGLFVTDVNGSISLLNGHARTIMGQFEQEASPGERIRKNNLRKPDGQVFRPEELPNIRALQSGEAVRDVEIIIDQPDQRRLTILSNAAPLRDETGRVIGSISAFNDITERKEAEDELKRARIELEMRVRERTAELGATVAALQAEIAERKRTASERDKLVAAVESAAEAIVVTDKRGFIQYVNPAFQEITGYQKQEAIGRDLHIFDSGHHDADFFVQMRETIRNHGVWKGRMINKRKDGSVYYEDCTISPVKDQSGTIVNYVSIKHDVTEKLRLESIAETVDTMNNIGYVFSGIRHEIGNPVSSLLIIMSLLKKKYEMSSKEAIKEYLDQAVVQVERLEYLLTSLKNFNMYENLQVKSIKVSSFMEKFLPLVNADLGKKGIVLQVEPFSEACVMNVDGRALQQALLNIIVNASDAAAGRPNPRISLAVSKSRGMIRVCISDNGSGIPEDRQKDLFKPFYTNKAQGTGLGLVITRKLVSRMKGFIEIASRKDEGTVVDIFLPEGTIEPAQ